MLDLLVIIVGSARCNFQVYGYPATISQCPIFGARTVLVLKLSCRHCPQQWLPCYLQILQLSTEKCTQQFRISVTHWWSLVPSNSMRPHALFVLVCNMHGWLGMPAVMLQLLWITECTEKIRCDLKMLLAAVAARYQHRRQPKTTVLALHTKPR